MTRRPDPEEDYCRVRCKGCGTSYVSSQTAFNARTCACPICKSVEGTMLTEPLTPGDDTPGLGYDLREMDEDEDTTG